jgi:hypothetical protein
MKLLKFLILVCGGVGLGIVLSNDIGAKFEQDKVTTAFIVGGFAVAALVGLLGAIKPPFEPWQATAALAGFIVVGIKTKVWKAVPHIADLDLKAQLGIAATLLGALLALVSVFKPER